MEIKRNEATRNRPQGDRVLDAPYVFADLPAFTSQVKDEKTWGKSDRNAITVFKTEGMTITLSALKSAAVIKDNTVKGFLTVQVIEGKIKMDTLEGEIEMNQHEMITFHPGVPHSIEAQSDSVLLLTTFDVNNDRTGNGEEY
jgi:quercetin dioxygenase-like cupin family protein